MFACLVVAAIGLVAAAEPETPASNWMPADQLRESVYRPGESTMVALEAAQTGTPSLADRLRAIRGGGAAESDAIPHGSSPAPADSAGAPAMLPTNTTASQLPSVLVRRSSTPAEAPVELTPSGSSAGEPVIADSAAEVDIESTDSMRRTARRQRSETPTFRAPTATANTSSRSAAASTANTLGMTSQGPMILIETDGPRAILVGKPANYRVRLANQGNAEADQMIVTVTVPAWAQIAATEARSGSVSADDDPDAGRRLIWAMERVAGRSQHELSLSLVPTENRPVDLTVDWVLRGAPAQTSIEVQQPQLEMAVDGPTEMKYGTTAVFTIRVSNPGTGPAENVVVSVGASGIANQPNTVGTLGAGESRTLEVELSAQQAGAMKIEAAAQADGSLHADASHGVQVRRAELAVKVTAPAMLYAGAMATYEIRVANTGDAPAEGVTLDLELPAGFKNGVGVDKKPIDKGPFRWRLGDLPAGSDRVYAMQCELVTDGPNQFSAKVQGADNLVAADTAVTTVEALADLKLIVNDPTGPIPVGQDVEFEIQVLNRGLKEATHIQLVAQFSEGIEPSSAAGHAADIVPGQVIFKPVAALPAGGQLTVKIMAAAQKAGDMRFRAELSCGDPDTRLVAEDTTRFYGVAAPSPAPQAAERPDIGPTPARR
ncbi:MAG: hypothetical protein GXY58_11820 [Planctomycetaceae bacterium]|nr:hypothetical protein [Planctomycetaceae bacterium]